MAEDRDTPAPKKKERGLWATAKEQWLHIVVGLIYAIVILTALAISILGYVLDWPWTGVTKKRFWHWLELLIVPVVLSGGGFLLYRTWAWENKRIADKHAAEKRAHEAAQDAHKAEKHASLDQIAERYLDSIQKLMVDREAPGEEQEAQHHNAQLSAIARARTLHVFEALDPIRKGTTIRFLVNAGLIMEPKEEKEAGQEKPVKSDTSGVVPSVAGHGPPIASPFFIRLKGANLRGAYLPRATLQGGASFAGTHLEEADLREANLQENNFQEANLKGANLWKAILNRADLSSANLKGAKVTDEQLIQAKSLKGATMPNGQKYEDWLKDKEGRREDGEDGEPS